jgi:putative DNA primase/helicase
MVTTFQAQSRTQTHQDEWLLESGVNESITTNSIESATDTKQIAKFLEWKGYYHLLGYFIYGIDLASGKRIIQQFKPDKPHPFPGKEPARYLTAKSHYDAILLDAPGLDWYKIAEDLSIPLHITEGGKKAGALLTHGYTAIALCGVDMWHVKGNKQELVPNLELIQWQGRSVVITLDADSYTNKNVRRNIKELSAELERRGATVTVAYWNLELGKGIDDVLVNHGKEMISTIMNNKQSYADWLRGLEKQFKSNPEKSLENKPQKSRIPPADLFAKAIASEYRDKLKFNNEINSWMRYEAEYPGVWSLETNEFMESIVSSILDANGIEGYDQNAYVVNVLKKMRHKLIERKWVERPANELIPFENGVLEVATRKLLEHDPAYHFTWCIPRQHNPLAEDWNNINNYLDAFSQGNEKLKEICLCFANAVLKGRADLQKFVHLIGLGGSGKGTLARLITDLIGQENILSTTLEDWCNNRFESANGYRKRLIVFWDEDKQVGKLGKFLSLTGGDWIRGEEKNKKAFQYRFDGLCLVLSNKPIFTGSAASRIARRAITLPCNNQTPKNQIRDLNVEFQSQLDAFTNYVLSIPDERVTQVLKGLADTPECSAEFWENRMRVDSIAAWVNEWVIQDVTAQTLIGMNKDEGLDKQPETLYGSYSLFCRQAGMAAKSHINFSPDLIELCNTLLGWEVKKVHTNKGKAIKGLRLRTQWDDNTPTHDATLQLAVQLAVEKSIVTVSKESDGLGEGLSDGLKSLQEKSSKESDGLELTSCEKEKQKISNQALEECSTLSEEAANKPSLQLEVLKTQWFQAITEMVTETVTQTITEIPSIVIEPQKTINEVEPTPPEKVNTGLVARFVDGCASNFNCELLPIISNVHPDYVWVEHEGKFYKLWRDCLEVIPAQPQPTVVKLKKTFRPGAHVQWRELTGVVAAATRKKGYWLVDFGVQAKGSTPAPNRAIAQSELRLL